ncbi:endonuclease MutS2 [Acanthopleuribacter pedis]|uniref:Smr/MutS family protein n=1 Tax=Acanthopleuribacter pedis TaxID=442870 RepID=A0A8J7U2R8_9BACT|nr:Smr/MutS family protein [Acanthopleuribacter pedis]MBO1318014.1 Smr/MutS family protein [Acanthopleuribacter pedis]
MNAPRKKSVTAPDLRRQTRDALEFETILAFYGQFAQTRVGRERVMALDLMPAVEQAAFYAQLDQWFRLLAQRDPLRFPTIPDRTFFARKAEVQPFDGEELRILARILQFFLDLGDDDQMAFALNALLVVEEDPEGLNLELKRLKKRLGSLFDKDGDWREDISPLYKKLIHKFRGTDGQLQATMQQALQRFGDILSEPIIFERNHRQVLAVKLDFRGKVRGILQDYSASGRTVFIEPEASVGLQNALAQIAAEIEEELWRIRVEISREILAIPQLSAAICPLLAMMDMFQALSLAGKNFDARPITPNHERDLFLLNARHPFLDQQFAKARQKHFSLDEPDENQMIAFTLRLDADTRGLIISGANTGGKTVTLKTTGLMAWMANSGLPVPVEEGSEIPFYDIIFADIGDHQSLSHNLSTYASHLVNMRQILERPSRTGLVLLDELGSGTDPNEGNALAQAMLEVIMERGEHLLATTHQQILCTLALTHPAMENGSMVFDPRQLKPTYRFTQGVPGRSHALEIASGAGLPDVVLQRAKTLIDEDQVDVQAAIRQLQAQHRELEKQKKKVRKDELRLHRRIQESRAEGDKLQKMQDEYREKERKRVTKAVEQAERKLRQMLSDVGSAKQARKGFAKFSAVKNELMEPLTTEKLPAVQVETSELTPDKWSVGDKVWLKTWRMEGMIQSIDRKKVRINCNGKLMTVSLGDLLHMKQEKAAEAPRITNHLETAEDHTLSMEVKMLGFRVDDALIELDLVIDRSLQKQMPMVRVIHGHGTGALKNAIREHLRKHEARSMFEVVVDLENDGYTELRFDY